MCKSLLAIFVLLISFAQPISSQNHTQNLTPFEIGRSFGESYSRYAREERNRKERETMAKQEMARLERQEKERTLLQRNYIFKLEMIRDYKPERHYEFVDCINRSKLPYEEKLEMLLIFETAYRQYKSTNN